MRNDAPPRRVVHSLINSAGQQNLYALTDTTPNISPKFIESHVDKLPIRVKDLSFSYGDEVVFDKVNFDIEQGTLVVVTGKRSQGKYTLLQILGQVQVPPRQGGGVCFVPSHLRILHIAPQLYFLNSTLRYNLFFGVIDSADALMDLKPAVEERAYEICRKLSLPEHLFDALKTNSELEIATLPRSDRALLSLARALIANPEVLVIHTPGIFFGAVRRDLVMRVLREYAHAADFGDKIFQLSF